MENYLSKVSGLILIFVVGVLATSAGAEESSPRLGPVERDDTGRVLALPHFSGDAYCKQRGARLPTVRQLAMYAQSQGAKGIRRTEFENLPGSDARVKNEIEEMKQERYYPIFRSDDFRLIDFYYSSEGYRPPSGEEGRRWIRSRSYHQVIVTPYILLGDSGEIAYEYWRNPNFSLEALRCLYSE
jgi:hypothetical protein